MDDINHFSQNSNHVLEEVWQCKACPASILNLFPDTNSINSHFILTHRDSYKTSEAVTNGITDNFRLVWSRCDL